MSNPIIDGISSFIAGATGQSPATGVAVGADASSAAHDVAQAPAAFSSVQNALSGIYDKLTDGKMWRSLGWLLLGVVLMIMGTALLIKDKLPPPAAAALAGL